MKSAEQKFVTKYGINPFKFVEDAYIADMVKYGKSKKSFSNVLLEFALTQDMKFDVDDDFLYELLEVYLEAGEKFPESGKIQLDSSRKIKLFPINPTVPKSKGLLEDFKDIVATDELRPKLEGVFVDPAGFLVATDAHKLVKFKNDELSEYADKIINLKNYIYSKGKSITFIDEKYVNYNAVIPFLNLKEVPRVSLYALYNLSKSALLANKMLYNPNFILDLKPDSSDNTILSLNPLLLAELMAFGLSKGLTTCTMQYIDEEKAIVFTFDNQTQFILMPIKKSYLGAYNVSETLDISEIMSEYSTQTPQKKTSVAKPAPKEIVYKKFEGDISKDTNYVPRREILSVSLRNGKVVSGANIVDGFYVIKDMFAEGGNISGDYKIIEGTDFYNNQPLYQVVYRGDDEDVEYDGEWHKNYEDALEELNSLNQKMARGGKIGFKNLAKKVAQRYEGKNVPLEYQEMYGKKYDHEEAMQVGNKVAGKVYWQQQAKLAEGGNISKEDLAEGTRITFSDYSGNEREGIILSVLDAGYEVSSGFGTVLVQPSMILTFDEYAFENDLFAEGGNIQEIRKMEIAAIEFVTGQKIVPESVKEQPLVYQFNYLKSNIPTTIDKKLIHDMIVMNPKSLKSRIQMAKGGNVSRKFRIVFYDREGKLTPYQGGFKQIGGKVIETYVTKNEKEAQAEEVIRNMQELNSEFAKVDYMDRFGDFVPFSYFTYFTSPSGEKLVKEVDLGGKVTEYKWMPNSLVASAPRDFTEDEIKKKHELEKRSYFEEEYNSFLRNKTPDEIAEKYDLGMRDGRSDEEIKQEYIDYQWKVYPYKMATGGNTEETNYERVVRNNLGKDVLVKIVKNPIFGDFNLWIAGTSRGSFSSMDEAKKEIDKTNFDLYNLGGSIPTNKSLKHFIMNEASAGMIASKTDYSDYKTIDEIRKIANKILEQKGDREYSLASFNALIKEAESAFKSGEKFSDGGNMSSRNLEIAKTIIAQLGGQRRLVAMTGANNFAAGNYMVTFRIKNPKVNYVKIYLSPKDLYDITFGKISGSKFSIVKEYTDIYAEDLIPIFEEATGMYLRFNDGGTIYNNGGNIDLSERELTQIASDYAYSAGEDEERATYRLLDPDFTATLLPKYIDSIKKWEEKYNTSIRAGEAKYDELYPQFAKGGMIEHGLRVGDEIIRDYSDFGFNQVQIKDSYGKSHVVSLENGKRSEAFAKGGYVAPSFDIPIKGDYEFRVNTGLTYEFSVAGYERKNDDEDGLYFDYNESTAIKDLGGIIIKNSAWKKLAKGETIMAVSAKGMRGRLRRLNGNDFEDRMRRISSSNQGYPAPKMESGGFVGKGEMVWKKISSSEKAKFLAENFTPEITPRSQELLVKKAYNFLPKNVKIAFEAKYANVEEYARGGNPSRNYVVKYDPQGKKAAMPTLKEAKSFIKVLKENGHTDIELLYPYNLRTEKFEHGGEIDDEEDDKIIIHTENNQYAKEIMKYADLQDVDASLDKQGNLFVITLDEELELRDSMPEAIQNLLCQKMATGGNIDKFSFDKGELEKITDDYYNLFLYKSGKLIYKATITTKEALKYAEKYDNLSMVKEKMATGGNVEAKVTYIENRIYNLEQLKEVAGEEEVAYYEKLIKELEKEKEELLSKKDDIQPEDAKKKFWFFKEGGNLSASDIEKRINFLKKPGNIVTFKKQFFPRGTSDQGYWQILVTGFSKDKSGAVKILGRAFDTPWYKSIDELLDAVDWESMSRFHGKKYAEGGNLEDLLSEITEKGYKAEFDPNEDKICIYGFGAKDFEIKSISQRKKVIGKLRKEGYKVDYKRDKLGRIIFYVTKELLEKGGRLDLFEDYQNIPARVNEVLERYSEDFEEGNYEGMSKAKQEIEKLGYTFEFYVDGSAYGLRPIGVNLNELEGYEDEEDDDKMAKGGNTGDKTIPEYETGVMISKPYYFIEEGFFTEEAYRINNKFYDNVTADFVIAKGFDTKEQALEKANAFYNFVKSAKTKKEYDDLAQEFIMKNRKMAKGGRLSMRDLTIETIANKTGTQIPAIEKWATSINLTDADLSNIMQGLGMKELEVMTFTEALLGNKKSEKILTDYAKGNKGFKSKTPTLPKKSPEKIDIDLDKAMYVNRDNIKSISFGSDKIILNEYYGDFGNNADAKRIYTGAYIYPKNILSASNYKQTALQLKTGGNLPDTATYIDRDDLISIVIFDETKDEEITVSGDRILNGFWFDDSKMKKLVKEAKAKNILLKDFSASFNGVKKDIKAKNLDEARTRAAMILKVPVSKKKLIKITEK